MSVPFDQLLVFLDRSEFFRDLDPTDLATLLPALQVRQLEPGAELFRLGDDGDAFYVVYDGTVRIARPADARSPGFAIERGPSTVIGEMALAEGLPRMATVTAVDAVTVLRFPRAHYERMLDDGVLPAWKLQRAFAVALSRRLRAVRTGADDAGPGPRTSG